MKAFPIMKMSVFRSSAGAALVLLASTGHAEPVASDKAAAEALFDEGRTLLDAGKFSEACPKLAASQRLDAGVGTLLYLGECYERDGKFASAWATFREAAGAAQNAGQLARAELARGRAATLSARVPRMIVRVATPGATDVEVRRDGELMASALFGSAIPLDPGPHTIQATAPGRTAWNTTITLAEGHTETVTVPDLAAAASAGTAPVAPTVTANTATPPADSGTQTNSGGWKPQHTAAVALAGAGVIGIGLGSYFGLHTFSLWHDSKAKCGARGCTPEGKDLADSARASGNAANVSFAIGGALLATGTVMWILAPSLKEHSAQVTPWATQNAFGVSTGGNW